MGKLHHQKNKSDGETIEPQESQPIERLQTLQPRGPVESMFMELSGAWLPLLPLAVAAVAAMAVAAAVAVAVAAIAVALRRPISQHCRWPF